jgi:peptidoglycan/LPS O-acetylase OafA/YrhL/lysophospholipase L1-like esterase
VEEQFYLVWPLLLAGGLSISRRRWVLVVVICAAIASAALMALLYNPGSDASRVYYGTDTRATPLMLGAILAFAWPLGRMTAPTGPGAGPLLDGVGLAGLTALVLVMRGWHDYDTFLYRGGFVIVAVAAAAVIAAAGHPASRLGPALGVGPLRWIGQRSYGIYLWHWPVMALTRPGVDLTWSGWILVPAQIIVTLSLATVSYRYLEMPVRRGDAWRSLRAWLDRRQPRQRLVAAACVVSVATVAIAAVALAPGTTPRSPLLSLASAAASARPVAGPLSSGGVAPAQSGQPAGRGVTGGVLAVGSSVMLAAEPELERRLHARVDATVGRFNAAIIDRLRAYRAARALPASVVVQLGDNDPVTSDQIAHLRAVLRGVPRVVLVNIREPGESWGGEVNHALNKAVRSWPAAIVADWRTASANRSLLWDGVHPDPAGQRVYAGVVARALQALTSRSPLANGQVTVVGDSVAGSIDETPQAIQALTHGLHIRLDLRVCRRLIQPSCTYNGFAPAPALDTVKSLGRSLGSVLVVDVGYNDDAAGYGSGIDQMMRAALAQGARVVIWVTLRQVGGYTSIYRATNAAIGQAGRRWRELRVADWNAYSAGKPWFADGLHPSPGGALALAEFLRSSIVRAEAGG